MSSPRPFPLQHEPPAAPTIVSAVFDAFSPGDNAVFIITFDQAMMMDAADSPAYWKFYGQLEPPFIGSALAWLDETTLQVTTSPGTPTPPRTGTYSSMGGAGEVRSALGVPLANITGFEVS